MSDHKILRNGSGYADPTASEAIYNLAKSGDIFEYNMPKSTKTYLIFKNHGKFSTALALLETAAEGDYKIQGINGKTYYTDPRMIQYIYNDSCGRFITSVSLVDFTVLRKEIGAALGVEIEQKTLKSQTVSNTGALKENETKEAVNHPAHYQGKHECIDEMIALFGVEAVAHFCMCNVYKYRYRASQKNGAEDIKKADWYMDYLMKLQGGADNGNKADS